MYKLVRVIETSQSCLSGSYSQQELDDCKTQDTKQETKPRQHLRATGSKFWLMDLRADASGGQEQAGGRAGASPVPTLLAGTLMPWGARPVPPCRRAWHAGAACAPRGARSRVSPVIPSEGFGTRQGWQKQPAARRGWDAALRQDGAERGERPRHREQHPGLKRDAAHGGPILLRQG